MARRRVRPDEAAWWLRSEAASWWTSLRQFDAGQAAALAAPDPAFALGRLAMEAHFRKTRAVDLAFPGGRAPGLTTESYADAVPRMPGRLRGDEAPPPPDLVEQVEAEREDRA